MSEQTERTQAAELRLAYLENMRALREKYCDTPAGFRNDRARQSAEAEIAEARKEAEAMRECTIDTPAPEVRPMAGREKEMQAIRDAFASGKRIVLLTGLGGFGKTLLAGNYAALAEDYDVKAVIAIDGDITVSFADDQILPVRGMQFDGRRYRSRRAYCRAKCRALQAVAEKKRMLIVLDQMVYMDSRALERLLNVPCDFLITTILKPRAFQYLSVASEITAIEIGGLPEESLPAFAELITGKQMEEEGAKEFAAFAARAERHPLAMKLWLSAAPEVRSTIVADASQQVLQGISLDNMEKRALRMLSLMPAAGVERVWFERVAKVRGEVIDALHARSLVQRGEGPYGEIVQLHPVVAAGIRRVFKPTLHNCRGLLNGIAADVENAWNVPREENDRKIQAVRSFLRYIPQIKAAAALKLEKLITFLWIEDYFEEAEDYILKLFDVVLAECGEPAQLTGEIALRVAAVYHNMCRYDQAEIWYRRGFDNVSKAQPADERYGVVLAGACNKMARVQYYKGNTEDALRLVDEAVAAVENYRTGSDEELLELAYIKRKKTYMLLSLGKVEEAESLFAESREIISQYIAAKPSEKTREIDFRETEVCFAVQKNDLGKAAELLERNLEELRKIRGPYHVDTCRCLESEADVAFRMGQTELARKDYLELLRILPERFPAETEWFARVRKKAAAVC